MVVCWQTDRTIARRAVRELSCAEQFQRKKPKHDGSPSNVFIINEEFVATIDWLVASYLWACVTDARGLHEYYMQRVALYKYFNGADGRRNWPRRQRRTTSSQQAVRRTSRRRGAGLSKASANFTLAAIQPELGHSSWPCCLDGDAACCGRVPNKYSLIHII